MVITAMEGLINKCTCKQCQWTSSDYENRSGILKKHLRSHGIIIPRLKPFDISEYYSFSYEEPKQLLFCTICKWSCKDPENKSGQMGKHLKAVHNMTAQEYIKLHPDQSALWPHMNRLNKRQDRLNRSTGSIKCLECGKHMLKLSQTHLAKHNLTPSQYKIKHNVANTASIDTLSIQSKHTTRYNLLNTHKRKTSSYEELFKRALQQANIEFQSPYRLFDKQYDFYIPAIQSIIEIDGPMHPDKIERLSLQELNTVMNDDKKDYLAKEANIKLYRIRFSNDCVFSSIRDLLRYIEQQQYIPDRRISYDTVIIDRTYFKRYIDVKGKDKLLKYVTLLLKFIRHFSPSFPIIPLAPVKDVLDEIQKSKSPHVDMSGINMNGSSVGTMQLKSRFNSYWSESFKNANSPKQAWNSDSIMIRNITYRIGCNNSNECFDFSLAQLVRGLIVQRFGISIFKPVLAKSIYQKFITNTNTPTVIDPCAGFGSRMIGFFAAFPEGTYIGIESDKQRFDELRKLSAEMPLLKCVIIHGKFEDVYKSLPKSDFIFTSIPYFMTEMYSSLSQYNDYNHWIQTFVAAINDIPGQKLINAPTHYLSIIKHNKIIPAIKSSDHFSRSRNLTSKSESFFYCN